MVLGWGRSCGGGADGMRVGQIMWGWGRWCEGGADGVRVGQMV